MLIFHKIQMLDVDCMAYLTKGFGIQKYSICFCIKAEFKYILKQYDNFFLDMLYIKL